MSKAYASIRQGLTEAIGHATGEQKEVKVGRPAPGARRPTPVNVAVVRGRMGFTQAQSVARFGVSAATLRHGERGDRSPQGPALVLLNLIAREDAGVLRTLCGGMMSRASAGVRADATPAG